MEYPRQDEQAIASAQGSDGSRYSLTVDQTSFRFVQAGVPRSRRTVLRYCARQHLDCVKVDTENSERYLIDADSVERRIEEIRQAYAASHHSSADSTRPDMSGHVASGRDTSGHGLSGDSEQLLGEKKELEERVEELQRENVDLKIANRGKDQFIELVREQSAKLIDQVGEYRQQIGELQSRLRLEAPNAAGDSDLASDQGHRVEIHRPDSEDAGGDSTMGMHSNQNP